MASEVATPTHPGLFFTVPEKIYLDMPSRCHWAIGPTHYLSELAELTWEKAKKSSGTGLLVGVSAGETPGAQ